MTTNNTGSDQGGELMACPFCGGDNVAYVVGDGCEYTTCDDCLANGPVKTTEDEAQQAWNTRAHPHERIRELEEEVARLRGHLSEHISFAEDRISDGKEMGFRVWRIALEDIARENRAILGKGTIA